MNCNCQIPLLIAILTCSACRTSDKGLFQEMRLGASSDEIVRTLKMNGADTIGDGIIRIPYQEIAGLSGVLVLYTDHQRVYRSDWILDDVSTWLLPLRRTPSDTMSRSPAASFANYVSVREQLVNHLNLRPLEEADNVSRLSKWGDSVALSFANGRITLIKAEGVLDKLAEAEPATVPFLADDTAWLHLPLFKKITRDELKRSDVSVIDDSVESGFASFGFNEVAVLWGIPGTLMYFIDSDSTIRRIGWQSQADMPSDKLTPKVMAIVRSRLGTPTSSNQYGACWYDDSSGTCVTYGPTTSLIRIDRKLKE